MFLPKYAREAVGLFFVVSLVSSLPVEAKVYKWVDEEGVTQYTQQPPQGISAQEIKPSRASSVDPQEARQRLQERLDGLNERRESRRNAKQEREQADAEKKELEAFCEKTRKNLKILRSNPHILQKNEDGAVARLTDQEREDQSKELEKQLKDHCET